MRTILILAGLLSAAPLAAQEKAPRVITTEDAVQIALKDSITVKNAEKASQIYDAKVSEYWGNVYPSLDVSGQYARNFYVPGYLTSSTKDNSYALGAQVNQVLWAGGKVRTGINIANILAKSTAEQLQQTRMEVARQTRVTCYDIILASMTVGIQEFNLELTQQHLDQVVESFRKGISSDLTVLQQKVEVLNAQPAVINAKNAYEVQLLSLKRILSLDPEDRILLDQSAVPDIINLPNLEELYAQAMAHRPEVNIARYNVDNMEQQMNLYKSEFYPSFYGFANQQYAGTGNNTSGPTTGGWKTSAGVTMSINLFTGGSSISRIKQSRYELEQYRNIYEDTRRLVRIQVKEYWLDLKEATERVNAQKGATESARQALRAVEIRFKNGLSGLLDMKDSSQALNKAQLQYVTALRDAFVAMARLKWATGQ